MIFTKFDLKEAMEVWQEEAEEKGFKIGIEKGMTESKAKIAQKLLAKGMSVEDVADATGLTVDEILKL